MFKPREEKEAFPRDFPMRISKYDYYKNKMKLAKQQDDGKALMAEDEAWLQMSSNDEDDGPMCMMADHEDEEFMSNDDDQDFSDRKTIRFRINI